VALLSVGSRGPSVTELQQRLAAAGYSPGPIDGDFGQRTRAAVTAFQRDHRLASDGVVGSQTWGALDSFQPAPPSAPRPTPPGSADGHRTLSMGSKGDDVAELQRGLAAKGFSPGPADGDFGPNTYRAVMNFQAANGLTADGVAGPKTWGALGNAPPAPPPPPVNGDLRQRILAIAQGEVGTREATNRNDGAVLKYPGYFGRGSEAYCDDFASYVLSKAGDRTNEPYCPTHINHLRAEGKWKGRSNPEAGDLVFFDWDHDGVADHVGIVKGVNRDGSIQTIEGNTTNPNNGSEGVWERTRYMSTIIGFGNP
jgi:peptidoglycan hydrolase-like protein with peptidoglycan-binding domain